MIDFRKQPKGYDQGIYDIPFSIYRAIPALNCSKLKKMSKSPLHFKTAIENPVEVITPQMQRIFDKGKAFDLFVLEGGIETLKAAVAIEPDVNRNTKSYKEWKDKVEPGKLILTESEMIGAVKMAEAAYAKKQFSKLFSDGIPHRVIIWHDQISGLWCKAEIDWITPDGVVVDLKSTADAGFWFFSRNSRKLKYANQGAFYCAGLTAVTGYLHNRFMLAAVEVDAPYESHVFSVPQEDLESAAAWNEDSMRHIRLCLDTDDFPGYPDEVMDLGSGQYLYEDNEIDLDDMEDMHGF
jgi:hypothetical protein